MAVLSSITMPAVERSARPTGKNIRQFNAAGHASTQRRAPLLRMPAEAPANAVEVPFTHILGKGCPEAANYTEINSNGDNRKWFYTTSDGYAALMVPNDVNVDANDDWLITVPVHIKPGNYVLSFEVGIMGSGTPNVELAAKMGTAPTVAGMTVEIAPRTVYKEKGFVKQEFNVAIGEENYYYFGFHGTTKKDQKGTIKLRNVGVREGSVTPPVVVDPPAAGTLTWTLAPKGELKATVVYTAPTKTRSGADLAEITKVEITSRWGVDKFTYDNVKPGQVITLENVEMYAGINNRFTGVAYVGDKAGDMVEHKSIFCGPDTPLAPADVRLNVSDDYKKATLSWTAPGEVGENGGYVDTDNLTYYIFDAFGNYYDPAVATTGETSYEFDYSDLTGQDFFAYQVTAGFGEKYSLDCSSNIATVGQPGALPFTESFTDGRYDGLWLIDPATTGSSTQMYGTVDDDYFASLIDPDDPDAPTPLTSHDGDNGFYYWLPVEKDAMFGLVSLRADISQASEPVLEFWYQGQGSTIDVLAAGGTKALAVIKTIDLQAAPTTRWTQARIPLDALKADGAVQFELRLTATHNDDDHTWSVPFDNIRVRDLAACELRIVSASCPELSVPGDKLSMKAHIENLGTETAGSAKVQLKVNGNIIETVELGDLPANAFGDAAFEYTVPLDAPDRLAVALEAVIDGEATPADNIAVFDVTVRRKPFAAPTGLTATADGRNVALVWDEPVNELGKTDVVTDDFESEDYTPMSISGAGEWTVYDGDGLRTYNVFREYNNPYQTAPMAFQLFNREIAEVPESYYLDAEPYSGDSFMMGVSGAEGQNDNWLISPALSAKAQTVKFMAKSFTVAWPETFKVFYSTTGNRHEDFVNEVTAVNGLPENREVPEDWTEFSFTLPEGATYFAINHDSYDTLALFVDDVTYEPAPEIPADLAIEGYHIFRDGVQLTDKPVAALSFIDSPLADDAPDGSYSFSYTVVPVYNYGPGAVSEAATVSLTLAGLSENISIPTDAPAYYDLMGRRISKPESGIFIRITDGKAEKVVVD